MLFPKLLISLLFSQLTVAKLIPKTEGCVTSIFTALNYISFTGTPGTGLWETRCQNPLKVISIYAASDIYCDDEEERLSSLADLEDSCREFGHVELLPREQFAMNLTEEAVRNMRVVEYLQIPRMEAVGTPVLISQSYYDRVSRTLNTWQFEVWTHHIYGYLGYVYWALILLVGISYRFCEYLYHSGVQSGRHFSPTMSTILVPFKAVHAFIETHLVIPSPLESKGRYLLWFTFPTRIQALIVILFWILSTVFCCVSYRIFPENIYWPDVSVQMLRYVADRTGIISFANLPLLWLFAGRNNIFIWATGWSFSTFNIFHRHIAWIATLQAVVHTVAYLILFLAAKKDVAKQLTKAYILWGTAATLAMVLVLPSAVDWMRRRSYEVFLLIHILFSVITVVGCFYHTGIFEGHEYWNYLWPVVWIWVCDRFLRLVRLIYCNIHVRVGRGKSIQCTRSTAMYDKASDVIRLVVIPGNSLLQPAPGQYYYLYQPFRFRGWESHPFTLGAWTLDADLRPLSTQSRQPGDVSRMPLLSESSYGTEFASAPLKYESETPITKSEQSQELIFWVRPFDGWTRSLRDQCLRSANKTTNTTILLEGPYGDQFPLWDYESVLLIAGGTGIASAIPYVQEHLLRFMSSGKSSSRIQNIHLVWSCRQVEFIRDIATNELRQALAREDFRTSFYTTARNPTAAEIIVNPTDGDSLRLHVESGRPDLRLLILNHAQSAAADGCTTAVLVCGPMGMADEAQAAVHSTMRQGYMGIRYIEESFSW